MPVVKEWLSVTVTDMSLQSITVVISTIITIYKHLFAYHQRDNKDDSKIFIQLWKDNLFLGRIPEERPQDARLKQFLRLSAVSTHATRSLSLTL